MRVKHYIRDTILWLKKKKIKYRTICMAIENNIDTVTIFVIFHFIKLPQKKMRMATLWNIAIFTVLLSNVMHIFFVNFERTKERENSPVSTLWTFFKNSENKYRRKILTEKEGKRKVTRISKMYLFICVYVVKKNSEYTILIAPS